MSLRATMEALAAPVNPAHISWRVGSTNSEKTRGMALPYIEHIIYLDVLNKTVGPDGWTSEVACYPRTGGKSAWVTKLSVWLDRGQGAAGWVSRCGAADDTDIEAGKGGETDSFKRACRMFGIGGYLYRLPRFWVPIEKRGKSWAMVGPHPELPGWALPGGSGCPPEGVVAPPPITQAPPGPVPATPVATPPHEGSSKDRIPDEADYGAQDAYGEPRDDPSPAEPELQAQPSGAPMCKDHKMGCVVRTSQSQKNPGRQFWACPKSRDQGSCGFNGWVS